MCKMLAGVVLVLVCATGCGAAPTGLEFIGLPTDDAAMTAVANDYARFAGFKGALHGQVDLHPHSDFAKCSLSNIEGCPHEFPPGLASNFTVVTSYTGSTGPELATTSYIHELTHAIFGDPDHERDDLFGFDGLVRQYNAKLAGVTVKELP